MSGLHFDCNRGVPRRHAYPDANSHANGFSAGTYTHPKSSSNSKDAAHPAASSDSGADPIVASSHSSATAHSSASSDSGADPIVASSDSSAETLIAVISEK